MLRTGENERPDGSYQYRWTASNKKRHTIYARTLKELREKEAELQKDLSDGIRTDTKKTTINDIYDIWVQLKKGLKDNTLQNYKYLYEHYVRPDFGYHKIVKIKKSDVRRFYNLLLDERQLKISTVDGIHTVLHQVFDLAVEDSYIRVNACDNAMKEIKKIRNGAEKRKALTRPQQDLFLNFLKTNRVYRHWYPIFMFMIGTGLRVGEVTGLRWQDVDFEKNLIYVTHTLVYYNRDDHKCRFSINDPKTDAGHRTVPLIPTVKEALQEEKEYQELMGIKCQSIVDGYTDFIFINRFGHVQHHVTLNKALKRIMRDCNQEVIDKAKSGEEPVLLPRFSCHNLRHTFTTRLCESGMNVKVIQEVLGHSDIRTTLDVYADVTNDFKMKAFNGFDDFMSCGSSS